MMNNPQPQINPHKNLLPPSPHKGPHMPTHPPTTSPYKNAIYYEEQLGAVEQDEEGDYGEGEKLQGVVDAG